MSYTWNHLTQSKQMTVNQIIHIFPKVINAKWNTNSLVSGLNPVSYDDSNNSKRTPEKLVFT